MTKIPYSVRKRACVLLSFLLVPVSAYSEAPRSKILCVGAISINACQDAKILADWYSRLGIETKEFDGGYYAKIETAAGTLAFAIHSRRADAPQKSSGSVSVVFRVEDFDQSLSSLKSKGLSPETTEKDAYGQFAHFHDPDGNEVTLWAK